MFLPLIRRCLEKLPLHVKGALRKITKSGSTGRPSLQPWVSRCARGTPHTVRETTKAGDWGRFPFNKNSGLKFQKFHMPNGTVPSGCIDPTQATTRLVIFISMIQKKRYWDNNFVKWKGTFRSDLPKWPDRSKLTTFKVPNIPVGPNRNGPFHLMYQPKFQEFWVEQKAPWA